jgi:hypothetical protein
MSPWAGDQSSAKASTYTGAGFEPAIPMFEWLKAVLSLDRVAIETGLLKDYPLKLKCYTLIMKNSNPP